MNVHDTPNDTQAGIDDTLDSGTRSEPSVGDGYPAVPQAFVWMLHARCRGVNPAQFFPSDGLGVEVAQRVCAACPVRVECLEYALEHRIEHGVWGGASERERRRILRRRRGLSPTPPA